MQAVRPLSLYSRHARSSGCACSRIFTGIFGTGHNCRCTGSHLRSRHRGALAGRGQGHPDFRRSDCRAVDSKRVERGETSPHDLMHTILDAYGGKVVRTVITLKGGTYYGALTVAMQDQVKTFDSRSSDSIALAVHFKAPIVVGRDLLESAGRAVEKSKTEDL